MTAQRVVLALGLKGFAKMPVALQGLPTRYVTHSAEYGDLNWASDKEIAIVGGGQSALGLAALLNERRARVHVLVRGDSIKWLPRPDASRGIMSTLLRPDAGLGRGWSSLFFSEFPFLCHMLGQARRKRILENVFGPAGAWWLHDRVVDKVRISLRTAVRQATIDNGRVVLNTISEGKSSDVAVDHVIAATGFTTDIRRHAFLSKEIIDSLSLNDGFPELTRNFETSIHGLYVIGPASAHSFGPVMRFVYGAKHAAPRVARHIGNSLRAGTRKGALPTTEPAGRETTGEHTGSV